MDTKESSQQSVPAQNQSDDGCVRKICSECNASILVKKETTTCPCCKAEDAMRWKQ